MPSNHSISQWQQANELFEAYADTPFEEALNKLQQDSKVSAKVEQLVIKLLTALSTDATAVEQADLSFFDSLQEAHVDLSGTNIGDYHLICQVGIGGMAQVYKAERVNTAIQKVVALKVLSTKQKTTKTLEELFEKEQITLSKLSHSNIISFHHGGIADNGTAYLVMEYIDQAQDISAYVKNNQLSTHQIIELVLPVIDAIGFAHQQLIVHKDIKPSNVLVDHHGKPFLLDFGIASISEQPNDKISAKESLHIYTPSYASPEQFLKQDISTSSDIFSFVAMLLDLLSNKKRTAVITDNNYDYNKDERDIDSILAHTRLDSDLKNILKKGLQEQTKNRYQSAQALKSDLQNWLKSRPVTATAMSGGYVFKKFIQRNPLSSVLVSVLIAAIVFSLAAMFKQMNKAEFEAKKSKQVSDFLIESIQASDPDISKGQEVSVKELLNNAKIKIQESALNDPLLSSSLEQNIGSALAKVGQYNDAEKLLLKAIDSDADNITAQLNLAQLYLTQKSFSKSQTQYAYLNKIKQQLNTQQQIQLQQIKAKQLLSQGDFDQAIEAIRHAINTQGIGNKQSIESHLILANILDIKGDSQKAVEVLENSLVLSNQSNGNVSTTSTNISNLLADALTNINPIPFEKILALYLQTIQTQEQLYGAKHPLVAKTYLQYGFALKATNNISQAKKAAQKAREIAVSNFGEKHILTAHSDLLLSQIELSENNVEQAIETMGQVVSVYEQTYGIDHYETNQVKTTLALYLIRAQKGTQATEILLSLYQSQKQQLGENHQATLYVVLNLLKAYNLMEDYPTAIELGSEALVKSQQHLGKEFVITIGIQTVLSTSYIKNNNPPKAIALLKPLLTIDMVNNNPAYHKKISELLIQAYFENKQFDSANRLIEKLHYKYYPDPNSSDEFFNELQKFKTMNNDK